MKLVSLFSFLFFVSCASTGLVSCASSSSSRAPSSLGPTEFAVQKARAKGASEAFLALVQNNYRADQRERVLELNFLGFLRANKATGDEKIPNWELERVQKFLRANRTTFREAEKKFQVPKEVIASLLWVETKHGRDLGTFHVASALFSMAQADYPTLLDQMIDTARAKAARFDQAMETQLSERAKRKSDWAAAELAALEEIHNKKWKDVATLNGSFSGAFGMAQFVPSSYITWARSKKETPNLFQAEDSILSVANYLQSNGWQRKRNTHEAALFHYNRDKAYVNHILRMSDCLKKPAAKPQKTVSGRGTASKSGC